MGARPEKKAAECSLQQLTAAQEGAQGSEQGFAAHTALVP